LKRSRIVRLAVSVVVVLAGLVAIQASPAAADGYKLPWAAGNWNVVQGRHDSSGGNAWDFQPPGAGSHNDEVLAVAAGTARIACSDSSGQATVILTVGGDVFKYAHLQASAVAGVGITTGGVSVQQGQVLGRLLPASGSFTGTCGYGYASHLHLEMPRIPFTLDGVTFSASGPNGVTSIRSSNVRNSGGPPPGQPFGSFDEISSPGNGLINVRGWTVDPDAPSQPTEVHVYVGGPAGSAIASYAFTAYRSRPDVAAVVAGAGPEHGFDETIDIGRAGSFPVYVYAINRGGTPGDNVLLGSRSVAVGDPAPRGQFDSISSPTAGQFQVRGWAFDPDKLTAALGLHVYVGGPAGTPGADSYAVGPANKSRRDVEEVYPGVGDSHGFDEIITTGRTGIQSVYVYALNEPGTSGPNVLLGARTVSIDDPATLGNFEASSAPTPGVVNVAGWTIDPNTKSQPNNVQVYVGGPAGTPGAEVFTVLANSSRGDVAAVYPAAGDRHGFNATFRTNKRGPQAVFVYAINAAGTPGANVVLGNRPVNVSEFAPSAVRIRLAHTKVKRTQRAKIKVTVAIPGRIPSGTVQVFIGRKKVNTVTLKPGARGRITVRLPKKKVGRYQIRAVYSGDLYAAPASSSRARLRVR